MIVIKVLPLPQFFIEKLGIINYYSIEHTVKLFFVGPMASFDLAIKSRSARFYIYVIYPLVQDMPMELSLKLRSVICLDHLGPERKTRKSIVDKLDGCSLAEAFINFHDSEPCTVINGGILIIALPSAGNLL